VTQVIERNGKTQLNEIHSQDHRETVDSHYMQSIEARVPVNIRPRDSQIASTRVERLILSDTGADTRYLVCCNG